MGPMISTELRLALAPERTYRELLARDTDVTRWQMLARPATLLLVIGVAIPMMALHRVTLRLVATTAVVWSAAVAIEFVAAWCVIRSVDSRQVRTAQAIDLWFAGHLPFSLWLLALPITTWASVTAPALEIVGLTSIVPLVWTAFIVTAFCRTVLGTTSAAARWRAGIHLGAFVIVASTLFMMSAGGGAALLSYAMRRLAK
jgi:hypothetical protein